MVQEGTAGRDSSDMDRLLELLDSLREGINKKDKGILTGVSERFGDVAKILHIKRDLGRKIEDGDREAELRLFHEGVARELGLSVDFVRKLFDLIIEESKRIQAES
mgnify:FL=1|jgi:chorismate mutase